MIQSVNSSAFKYLFIHTISIELRAKDVVALMGQTGTSFDKRIAMCTISNRYELHFRKERNPNYSEDCLPFSTEMTSLSSGPCSLNTSFDASSLHDIYSTVAQCNTFSLICAFASL